MTDYQPGMCATCTNRHLADLFEALGETDKAESIRATGCHWWWGVPEVDEETGQGRIKYQCGAAALPGYFQSYGTDIERASQQVADAEGRMADTSKRTLHLVSVAVDDVERMTENAANRVERALLVGGGGLVELAGRRTTPAALGDGGREGGATASGGDPAAEGMAG